MLKSKRLFLISIFTILISMTMLISVTFAWFTSTTSTKVPSIKSTTYTLSYEIETNDENSNVSKTLINTDSDSDKYYDATYNVVDNIASIAINLSATGTANASGYCIVKIGDCIYYTNTITSGNNYSFTIVAPNYSFSSGTKITLISKWGKLPSTINTNQIISNESNGGTNGISLTSLDEEILENITTSSNGNEVENDGLQESTRTEQTSEQTGTDVTVTPVQEQNSGEETQTGTQEAETKDNSSTADIGNNNNGGSASETGETDGSTEEAKGTDGNTGTSTTDNTQEAN